MAVPNAAKYDKVRKLPAGSVGTSQIAAGAVTTTKIADAGVKANNIKMFVSDEQTGAGSEQSVAHGLGVIPSVVLAIPTATATGAFTVAYGTHTSTNALVTVSNAAKYKLLVIA